ncbi:hypothetical protein FO519_002515 [Halicephalobus sp. NKZ332]|nr:hypothetical protein FO519_002515 [Halicephalobus sp. NKZ332]
MKFVLKRINLGDDELLDVRIQVKKIESRNSDRRVSIQEIQTQIFESRILMELTPVKVLLVFLILLSIVLQIAFIGTQLSSKCDLEKILHYESNSKHRQLPQALIIGARKGGTRALLDAMGLHPGIQAARREVHFFDQDENFSLGVNWYIQQMPFSLPGQITVEKTPAYLASEVAPKRVFEMKKEMKFIVILRNPVIRTISDFTQVLSTKIEKNKTLPIFESVAFLPNSTEINTEYKPIRNSLYIEHLRNWLQYFSLNQFLFLDGDKFIKDPISQLRKVEKFFNLPALITEDQLVFNEFKGFYCFRRKEKKSARCLGTSKGRPHVPVSPLTKNLHTKMMEHDPAVILNVTMIPRPAIDLRKIVELNEYVCTSLGFLFNFLLVYLITFKTSSRLHVYKKIFLQNCLLDIFYNITNFITHAQVEFKQGNFFILMNGPFSSTEPPWSAILIGIWVFALFLTVTGVPIQFIFRYALKKATLLALDSYYYSGIPSFLTAEIWRLDLQIVFSYCYTLVTVSYGIIIFTSLKVYNHISQSSNLSHEVLDIHKQITLTLMVQAIAPVIVCLLPIVLCVTGCFLYLDIPGFGLIVTLLWSWIPLVNSFVTILAIRTYRKFCFLSFKQAKNKIYTSSMMHIPTYVIRSQNTNVIR